MIFDLLPFQAPLWACFLLGILCSFVGVFIVYKKQSLVGETLAHASYPGIVIGIFLFELLFKDSFFDGKVLFSCVGAFLSSFLALFLIRRFLQTKTMNEDSALSFLLSTSFALSMFVISLVQDTFPALSHDLEELLIGQAALIQEKDVWIIFAFLSVVLVFFSLFRRSIQSYLFDEEFSSLSNLAPTWIHPIISCLIVGTVVLGIRMVGVVVMSSMLIFPALLARLMTTSLRKALLVAPLIGAFSSFLGVLLSEVGAQVLHDDTGNSLWLPTGPLITTLLAFFFFLVVLFSPLEGLVSKAFRRRRFLARCYRENILKALWKECSETGIDTLSMKEVKRLVHGSTRSLLRALRMLQRKKYIQFLDTDRVQVLSSGMLLGRKIVRLHRLWELYLVEFCKMVKEKVHPPAEEMEHILTPEIEKRLQELLREPKLDPHKRPIPLDEKVLLQKGLL